MVVDGVQVELDIWQIRGHPCCVFAGDMAGDERFLVFVSRMGITGVVTWNEGKGDVEVVELGRADIGEQT